MDSIKVGAVQPYIGSEIEANIEGCLKLSEEAAESEADLICLPEQWLSRDPYSFIDKLAVLTPKLTGRFGRLAEEYGVHILLGGCVEEREGKKLITCPVLGPDGSVMFKQSKCHLFRVERELFTTDSRIDVFKVENFTVGILICYDAVFPEAARILSLKGADIIFNPSRVNVDGVEPWHLYLKVRALENRVPIVGVNPVFPPNYLGRSIIVDLKVKETSKVVYPVSIAEGNTECGVILGVLNPISLRIYRVERLRNRNVKAYLDLLRPL